MQHDAVAVIDFGGQYAHLIATKVRRARVLAEIRQPEDPTEMFRKYKGIILSGSPALSSQGEDSEYNKEIFDLDVPILGFCFGHQEIAKRYGGQVAHGGREWGHARFRIHKPEHPLFAGLAEIEQVFMSHYDSVTGVGAEFEEFGYSFLADESDAHRFAAIGSDRLRRYGLQFHPEVDDTVSGERIIANFAIDICGCSPTWTMERFLEEEIQRIRTQVGDRSVFLLASGGVDSTVAAKILGTALGPDRLHLLHIDNGLMRKNESRAVLKMFAELGLDRNLHFVDASEDFLRALGDAIEPEIKRTAIGETFIQVFDREASRLGIEGHLLGQGTIYPDTIESGGTKRADRIKTHHNRVPVIEQMIRDGKVVEPLAELYKVEVRELGERIGIPHAALWRHPFPGPGLGVRVLCADGMHDMSEVARLTHSVAAVAEGFGLAAFVLPIRSVGVKADLRSYEHPVLLHGPAQPHERVAEAAGEILKKAPGVNRCIWNLAPSMPSRVAPLRAVMTRARLDLLREADHLVMEGLRRHGIYDEIWQCPTVLVPIEIDGRGGEMVIVRPVLSERAMTARPAPLPDRLIAELCQAVLALPGVNGLALDVTSKPPGTIEWE
jgi:GMP synthase (glutamine-hydrolysing)